ncbi:MAG: ApaG protein [Rickettsiales bacterium]|jgi:ApaG protein
MQYKLETGKIEISVNPEYLNSQINKDGSFFVWSYRVEIINKGEETIQLINRYWRIIDEMGLVQEVNGSGVIGEQPILTKNESFKYTSSVHLQNPSGIMSGHYEMRKSNGEIINAKIPAFSLDVPNIKSVVN